MNRIFFTILLLTLFACSRVHITDKDVFVVDRLYSPNKKYVVYTCQHSGIGDQTRYFYYLLKSEDSLGNLLKGELPSVSTSDQFVPYKPVSWNTDKSLKVKVNVTKEDDVESIKEINGVRLQVVYGEE